MLSEKRHVVAVVGGAVAGAQVAQRLAEHGAKVYVFEQNHRPFGKIEDGLPRWHKQLRIKEYERIKRALSTDGVELIPKTRVGMHISFQEVVEEWGFSAVVLAIGAWRDRPLPIEGAERFLGKGLIYQNPFIIAYNHSKDPAYTGPRFPIEDGALVIGGGLASIDVAKLHMIALTKARLAERGHEVSSLDLEKRGLTAVCEGLGLDWAELGIKGVTLVYRRGPRDLPVKVMPEGADETQAAKIEQMRERILARAEERYRFNFLPYSVAEAPIVEGDRLVGLRVRKMRAEGRKLYKTDALQELRAPYVISSIGSIPKPIGGIKMKGELLPFTEEEVPRLRGYPKVFGAGNVVTGKGNIMASRKHSAMVGERMVEAFLGLGDSHEEESGLFDLAEEKMRQEAAAIAQLAQALPEASEADAARVARLAKARQEVVGYDGELEAWVDALPPS